MALDVTFGVSTWLWTSPFNRETIALFPKIKSYGYDAVEIPVEDPSLIDLDLVKKALADEGLKAIICGAFGTSRDLTHDDPAFHQTCFNYLDSCLEIASELGAGFVAGPMYSAVGKARLVVVGKSRPLAVGWAAVVRMKVATKVQRARDLKRLERVSEYVLDFFLAIVASFSALVCFLGPWRIDLKIG